MSGTCSRFAPMYATGNSSQAAVFVSTTVSSTGFMASVTAAPVGGVVGLGVILLDQNELHRLMRPSAAPPFVSKTKLASGRPVKGTPMLIHQESIIDADPRAV